MQSSASLQDLTQLATSHVAYSAGDFVDLVFRPVTRRAMAVPQLVWSYLEQSYHPDLDPVERPQQPSSFSG